MKKKFFALLLAVTLTLPGAAYAGDYELMVAKGLAENYSLGYDLSFTTKTDSSADSGKVLALAALVVPYSFQLEWSWGNGYTTWKMNTEPAIANLPDAGDTIEEIHDYVLAQTTYGGSGENAYSARGVFVDGQAVCDGYTRAVLMLCQAAGIPCLYIGAENINHSFNLVYSEGQWYIVDATWDDTGGDPDAYFMVAPEKLPDHQPDAESEVTIADAIAFGEWYYGLSGSGPMTLGDVDGMTQLEMAQALRGIGMFIGTGAGFELERAPNRMELAVMFVRALGLEEEALAYAGTCPFTDVPLWAAGYAGVLYDNGLAKGYGDGIYGAGDTGSARDYATFLLRAMGYSEENGDFHWETAADTAADMGFLAGTSPFLRGDVAEMTLRALLTENAAFAAKLGIVLEKV
ncbi:MAG TPA: transglutaminase domain-containing protein [Candidatus Acidoferrum sp.]|nr:transglutaminase domain-containing protein [Candidatus Acidoferrum sp.]